jgi:RNA recognition motif-containing protein
MSLNIIVPIIIVLVIIVALVLILRFSRKSKVSTKKMPEEGEAANKQIYVGNLPYQVSEQDLKEHFGKYGAIEQVRIVRNYSSGRSKGFGFVTYRHNAEAKNALSAHGQKYKDRTIVVRIAKPR